MYYSSVNKDINPQQTRMYAMSLVLTRSPDESVIIFTPTGEAITVTVVSVMGKAVRFLMRQRVLQCLEVS